MRFLKYVLVVFVLLLAIGAALFLTLPADFAYRQGARYLGPVVLSGVSGTLWNGHADGISVFGRDLGEIDWRMAKGAALRGRIAADVRIQGTDVDAAGTVERESSGDLTLHDLRFRFPAEMLAPLLDIPDLDLLGAISGVVADATLRGGIPVGATGNARWSEAGVAGSAVGHFADIVGEFAAQPDGSIAGTAHDDGNGHLAVAATFRAALTGYEIDARLSARDGDADVQQALSGIGEPQPDGSTKLVLRGPMVRLY
ncbi:MAG TPA: type II secretion system protein N [Rhodanobacteraceae bacterium]|jgi:hypothetical protein|nr:type II secretion system protein N [Rhodanobacteraceae bacterium]